MIESSATGLGIGVGRDGGGRRGGGGRTGEEKTCSRTKQCLRFSAKVSTGSARRCCPLIHRSFVMSNIAGEAVTRVRSNACATQGGAPFSQGRSGGGGAFSQGPVVGSVTLHSAL